MTLMKGKIFDIMISIKEVISTNKKAYLKSIAFEHILMAFFLATDAVSKVCFDLHLAKGALKGRFLWCLLSVYTRSESISDQKSKLEWKISLENSKLPSVPMSLNQEFSTTVWAALLTVGWLVASLVFTHPVPVASLSHCDN